MSLFGSGKIPYEGDQTISGFIGPTGAQGLRGFIGATGATGSQGSQGIQGNTGIQGIQGIQGATGSSGFNAGTYTAVDYLSTGRESFIGDNSTGVPKSIFLNTSSPMGIGWRTYLASFNPSGTNIYCQTGNNQSIFTNGSITGTYSLANDYIVTSTYLGTGSGSSGYFLY